MTVKELKKFLEHIEDDCTKVCMMDSNNNVYDVFCALQITHSSDCYYPEGVVLIADD